MTATVTSYFDGTLVFTLLTITEREIIMDFITKFIREEDGVTAIEYGLIAALIAVLIIGGVTVIGKELCGTFNSIATSLGGSPAACPA